jgi:tetratricopeptide (TPR) repeat protein
LRGELVRFPLLRRTLSPDVVRCSAEKVLVVPPVDRLQRSRELGLEDPELLLCLCETLRSRGESAPLVVRDEAAFFFGFLEKPFRSIGSFDEREYLLGEFALIAGVACRFLFRRQEAKVWFARSEANFVMAHNSPANVARLAYQRLALKVEEREFDEVVELGPVWAENFRRLGLAEESLKCRFLEGAAYRELGRIDEAIEVFKSIHAQAEADSNLRLLAQAANGLAQFYRVTGNLKEALAYAKSALPLLEKLDNRVNLAKLRWCVGDIFREQGRSADALVSYRAALIEAEAIGIRGDVAALHLVVADLLLDAGQDAQGEWEVRAALPIIEEEKMVPEGMAALTLLRESLRRRQINRQALRDLHGYFQDNG